MTDPTYGGVAASFATLSTSCWRNRKPAWGSRTTRDQADDQPGTPGFQTAEFLRDKGLIDGVYPRAELREVLTRLLDIARPDVAVSRRKAVGSGSSTTEHSEHRSAWDTVRQAAPERLTALEHIRLWTSRFVELLGSGAVRLPPLGGVGLLAGQPVLLSDSRKATTPTNSSGVISGW